MNRRIGEGGEGIKRNILRPEIKGNAKRNVNCMQKGNRERMRKGESHDPPFPDLTIKQLYYSVNAFTIIRCYGRLIKSGGNDNCFELNNSFIDYS